MRLRRVLAPPATLAAVVLATALAIRHGAWLELRLPATPEQVAAAVALAVPAAILVLRPGVGLGVLVAVVFLNLSDVLVRQHDLPSVLQLLALPLGLAAWVSWRAEGRSRRGTRGHPLAQPLTGALAVYLVVVLLSTTWAGNASAADQRFVELAKAFAIYALVLSLALDRERLLASVWVLVACGALLAALGAFQVIAGTAAGEVGGLARLARGQIYGDVFDVRIAGPLGDPNFFAQILLLLVPPALVLARRAPSPRARPWAVAAAVLLTVGIVFTYSRAAALALGLVVALSLPGLGLARRGVVAVAAALAVSLSLLPTDFTRRLVTVERFLPGQTGQEALDPDTSFEKRRLVSGVALEMFLDHPVAGVGAGNYSEHFAAYAADVGSPIRAVEGTDERQYPHNLFLEIGAETGLVGLGPFLLVLATAIVSLRRARRSFLAGGDALLANLSRALLISLLGYLFVGLFLHGEFQRYLWLVFGLVGALEWLSADPADRAGEARGHERDEPRGHQPATSPA